MFLRPEIRNFTARIAPGAHHVVAAREVVDYFRRKSAALDVNVRSAEQLIAQMYRQMRLFALLLGSLGSISGERRSSDSAKQGASYSMSVERFRSTEQLTLCYRGHPVPPLRQHARLDGHEGLTVHRYGFDHGIADYCHDTGGPCHCEGYTGGALWHCGDQ